MGLSKENVTGLILALASSVFIGSSFIIKKQGLRRAASAFGVRAGWFFSFLNCNLEELIHGFLLINDSWF